MSYYTEKQFTKEGKDTAETSVLFQTYFSDVKGQILEAGCSVGSFLSLNPKQIQGIDFDEESVKICRQKGFNAKKMDLTKKLEFKDEEFEGVFSSYVIEHIQNPLPAVKELKRILKKKGKMVLMTNDWNKTHSKNFYDDYTHVRPFTKQSFRQLAYDAGFKKFFVEHESKSFRGFGWIIRKGILKPKQVMTIQKFLRLIGITNNTIVLVAFK
ncbi:MAG: hypothetical protein COT90_02895 [Candidatus Diapherotrites archaeon CG10_big_fil_rev_8_21_14_0_10_31_34]|nr:MAG: hypothetical protein COT90_02895 [Candidatus Diapherotrites archaeon CG10_big_fil_rev_8_21_14_0_10_31_34]